MMTNLDDDERSLSFKAKISLEDFGKALKAYNKLVRLFAGRDATSKEFIDWLVANEFVDVSPSVGEINEVMKDPNSPKSKEILRRAAK